MAQEELLGRLDDLKDQVNNFPLNGCRFGYC